jgi:peptidoglycan/LPS O-acetylase OafA/YrhL
LATPQVIVERHAVHKQAWALPERIPELDGIRGIAILLVMICHWTLWLPATSLAGAVMVQGKIGVDLFFVLSGFLITGILLDTQGQTNATRNFYIRRGLRIWPLYFAYLAVAFLAFRRMLPPHFAGWTYPLFVQNFVYFTGMGPFLDPPWSLAVEEQFYLAWPWVALRVRRETVLRICAIVLAVSPLIRYVCRTYGATQPFIYANTFCRLDGIAIGGLIAAWVRSPSFSPTTLRRVVRWAILLGITATIFFLYRESTTRAIPDLLFSVTAVAFGGLTANALLVQGTASRFAQLFRSAPLRFLGRVSFALYLINLPIYVLIHGRQAGRILACVPWPYAGFASMLLANAVLLALAACSWRFFEAPILKLKARLAPR